MQTSLNPMMEELLKREAPIHGVRVTDFGLNFVLPEFVVLENGQTTFSSRFGKRKASGLKGGEEFSTMDELVHSEYLLNQMHVDDIFFVKNGKDDFQTYASLGVELIRVWALALKARFPEKRFALACMYSPEWAFEGDLLALSCTVSFHQIREEANDVIEASFLNWDDAGICIIRT